MKKTRLLATSCLILSAIFTRAQQWYPLNESDTSSKSAAIQVFLPEKEKSNGTALLIFPGGGYARLTLNNEGSGIAKAFTEKGVTCFVVKYRLPDAKLYEHTEAVPLNDAIAAMRWVKFRSNTYKLDTARIGCIGFSAGGHLAATFGNHAPDDARPKFMLLVYPVISMSKELTHAGSRNKLLGENPPAELVNYYSNELQVTDKTPPAYITHTGDDQLVPVQNSIRFYQALQQKGINSELHLYPYGNHGFIFGIPMEQWRDPMISWLTRSNFFAPDIDGKGKTVILTFDDASQSHYSVIPQMLKPYNFGATFYVCEFPPEYPDSTKYMNWRQIQALDKMGYEIGNHTWHHERIRGLSKEKLAEEIDYIDDQCKKLGIQKPTSFCYPSYYTDSAAIPFLKSRKYLTAREGGDRPWYPRKDHPYYVPSFTIVDNNPGYFYNALLQATTDNAIVFTIHGVPDEVHPWVNTPPEVFATYMKFLYDHHFTVISMRDYTRKHKLHR